MIVFGWGQFMCCLASWIVYIYLIKLIWRISSSLCFVRLCLWEECWELHVPEETNWNAPPPCALTSHTSTAHALAKREDLASQARSSPAPAAWPVAPWLRPLAPQLVQTTYGRLSQGRPLAMPATLSTEHNASNAPLPSVLLVPSPPGLSWLPIAEVA